MIDVIKYAYVFAADSRDEDIYFVSPHYPLVFILDKNTYALKDYIELGKNEELWNVSEVVCTDDSIYTIPCKNSVMNRISRTDKFINKIKIEKKDERAWYAGCIVDNKLWVLPVMDSDKMYSICIDNLHMEEYPSIFVKMELPEKIREEYAHTVFTALKVVGKQIWFAERFDRGIFCFDTFKEEWERYNVYLNIVDLVFAEEKFWILSLDDIVYSWNAGTEINSEYEINKGKMLSMGENYCLFKYITYKNGLLWCLPDFSDTIVVFNLKTREEKYIRVIENYNNERICSYYIWHGEYLYVFSQTVNKMWIINNMTFEVKAAVLYIPPSIHHELLREKQFWEEKHVPLDTFALNCIAPKEICRNENVGTVIYGKII